MYDEVGHERVLPTDDHSVQRDLRPLDDSCSTVGSSECSREVRLANDSYLNGWLRRILDVTVALALLLLMAPLLALIAMAIRTTSPGPILFRQRRHGRGMKKFELLKFRSMHWAGEQEKNVVQAVRGDSRITPVGGILRQTSLDELPQLINVLKGEMSLVGPRPHAVEHDVRYMAEIPHYRERFNARPGLTGLAQINGARGCTPTVEDMAQRIDLDVVYLQRASLALDCWIFIATVKEVLFSKSAY